MELHNVYLSIKLKNLEVTQIENIDIGKEKKSLLKITEKIKNLDKSIHYRLVWPNFSKWPGQALALISGDTAFKSLEPPMPCVNIYKKIFYPFVY